MASSSPTGTVTFYVDQGAPKIVTMSNGQAQLTFTADVTATFPIGATYSGDSNYNTSTNSITQTVLPDSTTTSVTVSNPSITQGASVTLTAHITSAQQGSAPPTGGVQFAANSVNIGGGQRVSGNQAQITTSFSAPGSVQLQATYNGDENYSPSTGTSTITVVSAPPDFSITASGVATQIVSAGQTATFSNAATISALYGFSSQVQLTCSVPAMMTT